MTMMWGVRRGLFSNEAGQGSAPIAHAAAKTDEPVSEGVVALLEPFIDTIVICTMTGLAVIITGAWHGAHPDGDRDRPAATSPGCSRMPKRATTMPPRRSSRSQIDDGYPQGGPFIVLARGAGRSPLHRPAADPALHRHRPTRQVRAERQRAAYPTLQGNAVTTGAPLTKLAFQRGLPGTWGRLIVVISVLLFAVSTAISWSYYGDRCANYLFGAKALLPYKLVFVVMHFVGAVATLATVWTIGDIALGFVTFPNLLALLLLSGVVAKLTKSYFERQPWEENAKAHKAAVERERARREESHKPRIG